MQVPCPICKKLFPIQLIEEHANQCIGDPTKKRKYAEQKLENVMSGTFETQRKQLRYHGYLYKCSFNTLRVINSIYIGCGVALFVLGCFAFVDEQKFNVKIPAGAYLTLGSLLLGPLRRPNLICKGKRRKMILSVYILYLVVTALGLS